MTLALRHRGPDDWGTWLEATTGIGLGQTRLSILDLSPTGHQPMTSSCGRYVVIFNGEIYNFAELRVELLAQGLCLRGSSDTEVLVEALARWGADRVLLRLNGMFAFALWDRAERTLLLARDRLGIKPLYYGWSGGTFLLGSELKSVLSFPGFARRLNREALGFLLRYNYIPAPLCIWQGLHKLPAGHFLKLDASVTDPAPQPYWDPDDRTVGDCLGSTDEILGQLHELLRDSVSLQMVADVPLGAFLSGGIDSSLVVALMQSLSRSRVKTFTIGFDDPQFDESGSAREVARILGTDHTELRVSPQDALAVIPRLPWVYDEPFADSSQIPTCLLAELTRKQVTVSLSGDGGDELFAGYSHYFSLRRRWQRLQHSPRSVRLLLSRLADTVGNSRLGNQADRIFQRGWSHPARIRKLAAGLRAANVGEFYQTSIARLALPDPMLPGLPASPLRIDHPQHERDPIEEMVDCDLQHYLPEDILTKVDRATMAVGLEARVPLLDHRVVQLAARIPMAIKTRDQRGKWPLRQLLERYLPVSLVERPKKGFRLPLADWLRDPLRNWGEDLLSTDQIEQGGFLSAAPIRQAWADHLQGRVDRSPELWSILMFQAWSREWKPSV